MYNEQQASNLLMELMALPPQRRRAAMQKHLDIVLHPEFARLLATNVRHYSQNVSAMAAMAARSGRFDMVARNEQSLNTVRQIGAEVEGLRRAAAAGALPKSRAGGGGQKGKSCCCLSALALMLAVPLAAAGLAMLFFI